MASEVHSDLECRRWSPALLPGNHCASLWASSLRGPEKWELSSPVSCSTVLFSYQNEELVSIWISLPLNQLLFNGRKGRSTVVFSVYLRNLGDFMLLVIIQLSKLFMSWYSVLLLEYFKWRFKYVSCCSHKFFGHYLIKDPSGRKKELNSVIHFHKIRYSRILTCFHFI